MRIRVCVHALDRTGPPMLARALIDWIQAAQPDTKIEVVAFRGGALLSEFVDRAPTVVALHPFESWGDREPSEAVVARIHARLGTLAPVDATLLVSVSAAQVLPYLPGAPSDWGVVAAWVVEQGEDLHWLDPPHSVGRHIDRWIAGSDGTRRELELRGVTATISVAPEFVDVPSPPDPDATAARRQHLGVQPGELLVIGAGIATHRKAPDLFVEVALACARSGLQARFVWIGGEHDELFALLCDEIDQLGLGQLTMVGSVEDLDTWIAAADVLVHPARLDAFPLVCLHAAALSVPVVGFAGTGWLEEMFGDAAVGAPFPDVQGLVTAMVSMTDLADRTEIARAQTGAISRHLSGDTAGPIILDVLARP